MNILEASSHSRRTRSLKYRLKVFYRILLSKQSRFKTAAEEVDVAVVVTLAHVITQVAVEETLAAEEAMRRENAVRTRMETVSENQELEQVIETKPACLDTGLAHA